MKKRLDALNRISRLQGKLRDLGQWRLSALEQEHADLSDDLQALFAALESGDLTYGPQAALSARTARALQRRIDALKAESERVRRKAETHGLRAKLAEEAAEAAAKAYREHKERKELAEVIEHALARRGASQR
jgi:hypothetical protein